MIMVNRIKELYQVWANKIPLDSSNKMCWKYIMNKCTTEFIICILRLNDNVCILYNVKQITHKWQYILKHTLKPIDLCMMFVNIGQLQLY